MILLENIFYINYFVLSYSIDVVSTFSYKKCLTFVSMGVREMTGYDVIPGMRPLLHGLDVIPAWIYNHRPSKVWDEITYPFQNFNGCAVEFWEWISNFIPHMIMNVITSSMLGFKLNHVSKGGPW